VVLAGDPLTLAQAEQRGEAQAARWKLPAGPSLKDLRAVSAVDILNVEPNYLQAPAPNLGITVDGYVFPTAPAKVFAAGEEHRVALLLGNNSLERAPGSVLPTDLKQAITEEYGPLTERAWSLYAAATNDPDYGTPTQQWADDTSFRCAAVGALLWHAAAGNPTYEYEFARVPSGRESVGAVHASDLPYVFGTLDKGVPYPLPPPIPPTVISDIDWQVSKVMQQYWTNFAKTGNPNGAGLPEWRRFDASSRAYIQFTAAGPMLKAALRRPYCDVFIDNVNRLMSTGGK
jgi:para-nitrobenzyl esterase